MVSRPAADISRGVSGVALGFGIFLVALYVVPSLGPVARLVESSAWLSEGEVTQLTLLIVSLSLIYPLGKGKVGGFGLRGATPRQILVPALTGMVVAFIVLVLSSVVMMATAGPPEAGSADPPMNGGWPRFVLSVVFLASICEEVFARGLVLGYLAPLTRYSVRALRWRLSAPVLVSALGFGLGHLCLLGSMDTRMVVLIVVNATVLGLLAGYHREKTGSILPAIAVHMAFNIVGGLLAYLSTAAEGVG